MIFAFCLGRNTDLSIAELGAVLGSDIKIPHHRVAALFEGKLSSPSQNFLNRLGGCTEILEIFEENTAASEVEKKIMEFLLTRFAQQKGKIEFALNLIPENKNSRVLKLLIPRIKKALQGAGRSAAFMNKNFQNVNAVFASKQNLTASGGNISIIDVGEGRVALGSSLALQDFEAYSKRDYGKPFRDAQVGMIPPKLAQVMINLALGQLQITNYPSGPPDQSDQRQLPITVMDPFCGTGTILIEAMLMGFSVIGSDKEARLVEGAEKNIDWLRQAFPKSVHVNTKAQLFQKDATALKAADVSAITDIAGITPGQPLALVTEPYLGPPLTTFPAENFLTKLKDDLGNLYVNFFQNLSTWLPKGTPIVFIFPYWKKHGSPPVRLAETLVAKIEALGYSKSAFVPLHLDSLLYERSDQIVGREIVRFIKVVRPHGRA